MRTGLFPTSLLELFWRKASKGAQNVGKEHLEALLPSVVLSAQLSRRQPCQAAGASLPAAAVPLPGLGIHPVGLRVGFRVPRAAGWQLGAGADVRALVAWQVPGRQLCFPGPLSFPGSPGWVPAQLSLPGGQGDALDHEGSLRGAGEGRERDSDTLAGGCGTPKPPLPPDLGTLGQGIWASGVTTHPARPQRAATDGAQSWAETCPAHLSSPERSCHPQTPRQRSVVGFASGSALVKLRACHRFPELPPALTLPATSVYPLDLDGNGEAREASPGSRRHARRALIRAGKSPPTGARGSEPGTD